MTPKQLQDWIDSAEESIDRLRGKGIFGKKRQSYEHPNKGTAKSSQASQAANGPGANGSIAPPPSVQEAIAAAVALGVKRKTAEERAKLAPDQSSAGTIVAFILSR